MKHTAKLFAEQIRPGRFVLRPCEHACGTMGNYPFLWTAEFVNAGSEAEAISKATYSQVAVDKYNGQTF